MILIIYGKKYYFTIHSIMNAIESENIMELTNILLKEIIHTFELIFAPNVKPSDDNQEISYIMSSTQLNTHISEISNNATMINIIVLDLLPLMDLGKTTLDEDILGRNGSGQFFKLNRRFSSSNL